MLPNAETISNAKRVTRSVQHAVSDSGATGNFLVEGPPVKNKKITSNPIHIKLPNGRYIQSTHICNLYIPWLPDTMIEAQIVPGLEHSYLISTRKFCDSGCTVFFDKYECRVYFKGELVLLGGRDETTKLWKPPINPISRKKHQNQHNQLGASLNPQLTPQKQSMHAANSLYTLPYKKNQLKCMHQSYFNSPLKLLTDAALNNQLMGIPFIHNPDFIQKYLAPSPATPKGQMKRPRSGIRSTRKR